MHKDQEYCDHQRITKKTLPKDKYPKKIIIKYNYKT